MHSESEIGTGGRKIITRCSDKIPEIASGVNAGASVGVGVGVGPVVGAGSEYWFPRTLVIGPGGVKGLKVLGFLSPIEDAGILEYVDTYCGVSVGAVISLLIVAGYKIREIVGEAATLDIFKDIENLTVQSMVENKGFMSNEPFRKRLSQLILNKFGTIPTLYNLYMLTGKAFIAVTLNATDEECVMMGPFTHPRISCVDATMFSINIPFFFFQLLSSY